MRSLTTTLAVLAMAALTTAALSGCRESDTAVAPEAPAETTVQADMPADLPEDVAAELAKLPEGDRQLAIKQRICPVADGLLGSMGVPQKLDVEGRVVFICCEGCEDKLRSDPEKYFAIIDNQ